MSFFLVSRLRRSVRHIVCISLPALLAAGSAGAAENPLLRESTLPFGYPHFDLIKEEHFAPAYEQAIAEVLEQSQRIAAQAEEPTFENTIVALERSGRLLERVSRTFSNLNGTVSTPAMQAVEKAMAPKLAAQKDEVFLNDARSSRACALSTRSATRSDSMPNRNDCCGVITATSFVQARISARSRRRA
ncbi:MAG: hypothetical protein NVV63_07695 [Opitutus sp.]|nr:hypothetical protein [Opitutus sp.]